MWCLACRTFNRAFGGKIEGDHRNIGGDRRSEAKFVSLSLHFWIVSLDKKLRHVVSRHPRV